MSEPIKIEIVNPNVPTHNLQTKIITPTKETQVVTPDEGYYGLSEVIVSPPTIDGEEIIQKVNEISETLSESYVGGNAKASEILEGKTAYVKGKKVQGTIEKYNGTNKIEVQKDEVGTYTLSTANKYVENDINVEIVEKKTSPYDYFKNILDNDPNPTISNYQYKYKVMFVFSELAILVNSSPKSIYYKYRVNDSEEIISGNIDFTMTNELLKFNVYNEFKGTYEKFGYIILYSTSQFYPQTNNNYDWYNYDYIILNEMNLKGEPYSLRGTNQSQICRKTNITYWGITPFFRYSELLESKDLYINKTSSLPSYISVDNIYISKENDTKSVRLMQDCYFKSLIFEKTTKLTKNYSYNNYNNMMGGKFNTIINADLYDFGEFNLETARPNFINLKLFNIRNAIILGKSYNYGYELTYDSIIHTIRQLIDTGSTLILTIGSINKNKIANTYVKLIEITADMLNEDELVPKKKPFAICESTDTGAMTIDEYVALKNWKIA